MFCYNCWNTNTKVIDSRASDDNKSIRRRRECEVCNNRFTTFEKVEVINMIVLKSWWKKERYSRDKLEDSIIKATNKRSISYSKISSLIWKLESKRINKQEIDSKDIWKELLEWLKGLDKVAYIRYASVYHNFETEKDFIKFISPSD